MTPLAVFCVCVALTVFAGVLRFQHAAGATTPVLDTLFLISTAGAIVSLLWVLSRRASAWASREADMAQTRKGRQTRTDDHD